MNCKIDLYLRCLTASLTVLLLAHMDVSNFVCETTNSRRHTSITWLPLFINKSVYTEWTCICIWTSAPCIVDHKIRKLTAEGSGRTSKEFNRPALILNWSLENENGKRLKKILRSDLATRVYNSVNSTNEASPAVITGSATVPLRLWKDVFPFEHTPLSLHRHDVTFLQWQSPCGAVPS